MTDATTGDKEATCLIIGAGIAGLMAARDLQRQGVRVIMVEKARGVGGRMATRRFAGGVFDHGTQYFAPSSAWFQSRITEWVDDGIAGEWFRARSFEMESRFLSAARYCGYPTMTAIPKHLANGVEVHLAERVTLLRQQDNSWTVETEQGKTYSARSCILTPPVPQTLRLLHDSSIELSSEHRMALEGLEYEPCLTLMALCASSPPLPENGVLEFERGNLRRIMDNAAKRISDEPAVTIHAMGDFSIKHFDDDTDAVAELMLEEVLPILQVEVKQWQLHRWRYSQVLAPHSEPTLLLSQRPALAIAGDAFGINGVEGAARSGMQAAQMIMRHLA
jgi:predicted NAD/FAD-dependent oxidoreductase